MKTAKRINQKLGSYMPRRCANENCPQPFEPFLSLSGLESFCPVCRRRLECGELARKRRERIEAWRRMGAGMRLLFSEGSGPSLSEIEIKAAKHHDNMVARW